MVSLVTPWGALGPPLSPTNLGMHGGACTVMFSCNKPPGAHLLLSPSTGRPSESTFWAASATPAFGPPLAPVEVARAAPDDAPAPPPAAACTAAPLPPVAVGPPALT